MDDHEELCVLDAFSPGVVDLKAQYVSTEAKVSIFETNFSGLRNRLDQMSPFLEEVKKLGSPTTLDNHAIKLK